MSSYGSVLVLGGTGFVGRAVCDAFAARGAEVVAAARRPPGGPGAHRFLRLDPTTTPAADLAERLDAVRPRTVVNTIGSIWGRTDREMWDAATLPTLRLLEALTLTTARPRLIHLGSVLEYGPVPPGTTVGPATVPRPDTAYGRAKLAATRAVLAACADGRAEGMVLRVANVAGPGTPPVSLLGRVAAALLAAGPGTGAPAVVELAPLRAHRDYIDVRDVADAVVAAAGSSVNGEAVDIARGEAVAVRALVDLLIEVSGVPATVRERPPVGEASAAAEDWLRVDTRPARELLGFAPRRSLEDAVRAYWRSLAPAATDAQENNSPIHPGG
ncbi:NAD-dependent epimerase/dehydratase family protein [Streptomyces sp. URMC 123]|uniref:NAD-dependent epimerase/dehydratase family protein n=1 Tax=Streptomyces sp. URMC 123 TaxID=3423403 RepID=UPI003F1C722A